MYAADHISAVRRNFESRAMPETEKPPAGPVDIYYSSLLCRSRIPWIPMSNAIKSIERTSLRNIRSGHPPLHNANAISGYPKK